MFIRYAPAPTREVHLNKLGDGCTLFGINVTEENTRPLVTHGYFCQGGVRHADYILRALRSEQRLTGKASRVTSSAYDGMPIIEVRAKQGNLEEVRLVVEELLHDWDGRF